MHITLANPKSGVPINLENGWCLAVNHSCSGLGSVETIPTQHLLGRATNQASNRPIWMCPHKGDSPPKWRSQYIQKIPWYTMYVCTYVRMHVCTYARMYVCTYVRTYVYIYIYCFIVLYIHSGLEHDFLKHEIGVQPWPSATWRLFVPWGLSKSWLTRAMISWGFSRPFRSLAPWDQGIWRCPVREFVGVYNIKTHDRLVSWVVELW